MANYRYGVMSNIVGNQWYQVQKKRMGIWFDDESFSDIEDLMNYVDHLIENRNTVFRTNM